MPVIKGVSYCLAHTPDILYHNGSTQTIERAKNSASEYLIKLKQHLRSFEDALNYIPNQAYIGNIDPEKLKELPRPWYNTDSPVKSRTGRYGEIMPSEEFYGLIKICDAFDLVVLEEQFLTKSKNLLAQNPVVTEALLAKLTGAKPLSDIEKMVSSRTAEGLYLGETLVGCIRQAHELDENLSAHIILENLASKASGVLAILHLLSNTAIEHLQVEYILECSEEACGDMNQRGGGNFAKAIGEIAGLGSATGSDIRAFCAGPSHALLQAASLVDAGVFQHVLVVGGGAVAKLGMNAKDHIAKNMPALEDMLGAFAVLVAKNDGINPVIRLDVIGRHTIASGASPQQVMKALVGDPLSKLGKKITEIDYYAVEMQNPELTEPAGAGNVPEANYKMIGALAALAGEIARTDLPHFVAEHGIPGFAPTQGHIPSGIPLLGFFRDRILSGKIKSGMVIGKGSLFLARMTNLFDGLSLVIEKNPGLSKQQLGLPKEQKKIKVGVTVHGSELGPEEVMRGIEIVRSKLPDVEVVVIDGETDGHAKMEEMLTKKELDAAVTMHYNFPIGVTTIGLVITPGRGKPMFIASSTGASAVERNGSLLRNAIYGIATAKAYGIAEPKVGLLNIDGARQAERNLKTLSDAGFSICLTESSRADGGPMRGNDLLAGTPDVMVTDTLTGNLLVKMFSAFTTGGNYESVGFGYGPGVGEGYDRIINIISRASGAPVIANSIEYAALMAKNNLPGIVSRELQLARQAGLTGLLNKTASGPEPSTAPAKKAVTCQISGVDVLELDAAQQLLWQKGIYAETGMGCTGPVVLVAEEDSEAAMKLLKTNLLIV